MKAATTILATVLLGLGGLGLAGCSKNDQRKGPGVVENTPPQPTTGTVGTKAPTPPASTSTTG